LKRITVVLEDYLHKQLKIQAVTDDTSLNDLVITACKLYMQESHKHSETA